MLGLLLSLSGRSVSPGTEANSAVDLLEPAQRGDEQARNELLDRYTPLVLRVGSQMSGRYLQVGRDEEVSVGLLALNEAIDRFDSVRGAPFGAFAEMVIKRRLIDHYRCQKTQREIPISGLESEDAQGNPLQSVQDQEALGFYALKQEAEERKQEIVLYAKRLEEFGIQFRELAEISPKHKSARERAQQVARTVAENPLLAQHVQTRKELPLKQLERRVNVSRKTLERQRKYIIAITLILLEDFHYLKQYISQ